MAKNAYFDTMHPPDCWKGAFFYLESYRFLIEMRVQLYESVTDFSANKPMQNENGAFL